MPSRPSNFMKIIYVNGTMVKMFKNGIVKVMTLNQTRCLLVLAYLNEEGMLEDEFFESFA